MLFHKVTQEEITKAKLNGDTKLFNKLCHKFLKQHGTSKLKKYNNWLRYNAPIIGFYLSIIAIIISLISLLAQLFN